MTDQTHAVSAVSRAREGNRLRIGFLVGSLHVGGSELSAFRTARAIARSTSLTVYHLPAGGPMLSKYEQLRVPIRYAPIGRIISPKLAIGLLSFARRLRRDRIQILHCHDYYANIVGAVAALIVPGLKLVVSRRWRDQYIRQVHERLDAWADRRAALILVNSVDLRTLLTEEVGVRADRIGMLSNFIADADLDAPRGRKGGEEMIVGSLGRLSAVKNLRLALDALIELAPRHPTLRWHVCGDGEQRDEVQRWVAESGIADRVVLRGPVPDGMEAARSFDVLLLTSVSEGSPNAVLEAMASGTPVVATSVGGVPEIVTNGVSGLLVPSGNREALVEALDCVLSSPALRESLARGGRAVAERHRESRVVGELLDRYAELAGAS